MNEIEKIISSKIRGGTSSGITDTLSTVFDITMQIQNLLGLTQRLVKGDKSDTLKSEKAGGEVTPEQAKRLPIRP